MAEIGTRLQLDCPMPGLWRKLLGVVFFGARDKRGNGCRYSRDRRKRSLAIVAAVWEEGGLEVEEGGRRLEMSMKVTLALHVVVSFGSGVAVVVVVSDEYPRESEDKLGDSSARES